MLKTHWVVLVLLATAAMLGATTTTASAAGPTFGDTLTANTKLDGNLSGSGTGLIVGADGITIDLGGYTLTQTAGAGWGIDNTGGYDDVTIRNGSIVGFDEGVRAIGADGLTLRDLTIDGASGSGATTGAVHAFDSTDVTILDCSILVVAGNFGPHCIRLDSVTDANVRSCSIAGGFIGVSFASIGFAGSPSSGSVQDCVVDTCFIGVLMGSATDVKVLDNVVKNGNDFPVFGSQGIRVGFTGASGKVKISGNEVFGNFRGILGSAVTATVADITDNEVYDNTLGGIQLFGGSECKIADNDVHDNAFFGISLAVGTSDCHVADNDVADNGRRGIVLTGFSNDNRITGNTVTGNGVEGITLFQNANVGNWISDNTALANGVYDLFHNAASTPNTWKDNEFDTSSGADI